VNSVGVNDDAIDEVSKSECEYKLRRFTLRTDMYTRVEHMYMYARVCARVCVHMC